MRDTGSEVMDELTTAAMVLAMDVESNADEDEDQEVPAGKPSGEDVRSSTFGPTEEDKENHLDLPEQREVGTDYLKVSKHNRTQHHALPTRSFTLW